jgi:AraC family transcriptional regulator of adaptative response / methylphosphotriester-DNA alkyltransferase methyltransferase
MTDSESLTDERWQAIIGNDASHDGKFLYAVKTTGIFCRPSCKSRAPKRENVRIFLNAEQAVSADYRPCKRCRPTGLRLPDVEWAVQIANYIEFNFSEPISLATLADMCHGSPYHLHRTFKRIKGITPAEYVQQTRMAKAVEYLEGSDKSIAEIALSVGLPNTPYFITLFKKITGHTPAEYRQLIRNKSVEEVLNYAAKY